MRRRAYARDSNIAKRRDIGELERKRGHKMIDFRDDSLPARTVRETLALSPHPEGGHFREVWRDVPASGARGAATSILFLLAEGEISRWHRVDAAEIWLWQAGAPLDLGLGDTSAPAQSVRLGPHPEAGEVLQAVVPAGVWQEARSLGAWSLVGCIVAPAFEFSGFELAPPGWEPPVR
jgi:predicted cupin superfamily sugar epimerase